MVLSHEALNEVHWSSMLFSCTFVCFHWILKFDLKSPLAYLLRKYLQPHVTYTDVTKNRL